MDHVTAPVHVAVEKQVHTHTRISNRTESIYRYMHARCLRCGAFEVIRPPKYTPVENPGGRVHSSPSPELHDPGRHVANSLVLVISSCLQDMESWI